MTRQVCWTNSQCDSKSTPISNTKPAPPGNGGVDGVSQYWDHMSRVGHHVCGSIDASATIPIAVHSDGGEVYTSTEFSMYSWSSCLTTDISTFDSKHVICVLPEEMKVKHTTDKQIIEFIQWSLGVMESGKHPVAGFLNQPLSRSRTERAGTDLAGGWKAALSCTLGELKEKVKVHRYHRNYNCNFLCEKCLACKHLAKGNAYDFRDAVLWRRMRVCHRLYLSSTTVHDRSPWCSSRSWRTDRHKDDLLHGWWLGFIKVHY